MKIIATSDTHMGHWDLKMPPGDIFIHAGDSTFIGNKIQLSDFNKWLGTLPYKHKIIISGNHDLMFEESPAQARSLITNATYLQDSGIIIEGIKFWGSPWQPAFCNWAFNLWHDHELRNKWALIPNDTDVLITHCPPKEVLDRNLGCLMLLRRVLQLEPKLHIFGHIHEGYGARLIGETKFCNVSAMDDRYMLTHPPMEIEI